MKTITIGPNTICTLSLRFTSFNSALNRLEIKYRLTNSTVEPKAVLNFREYIISLRNAPAQYDENNELISAAVRDLDNFKGAIKDFDTLMQLSFEAAVKDAEKRGVFVPYVDPTAETWRNEPINDNEPAPEWQAGQMVMAGMVRTHKGIKSRALCNHKTSLDMEPGKCDAWGAPGVYRDTFLKRLSNLF